MNEETTSPVRTPTEAPSISPEEEVEGDPSRLCPAQKVEITRRLAPLLP